MFATNLGGQPGTNLRLYTVGVGDNHFGELGPLKLAASAGHGLYFPASNFAQLERNIENVFLDIISNSTSFSVAAITTVQTRGTTFAFIPRFRPLGGSQWEGRLYRFRLFNEFDAGIPSAGTNLIAFNNYDGGVATMTDYMKLSGVNSDFCVGMGSTSRHVYSTEQDCGTDLMKFVEGRDILRQNVDGGLTRPNILGDIFHSSPILLTPPVPTFLCDTGIMNQCVRTLYAQDVSGQHTPNSQSAYTDYYNNKLARQELILVGANDGMLHAFHAGNYQDGGTFDDGTGQEDRKSTRLNSSHLVISYAVFCLKKKKHNVYNTAFSNRLCLTPAFRQSSSCIMSPVRPTLAPLTLSSFVTPRCSRRKPLSQSSLH